MTEKISIIVPVYKVEKYLDKCVRSIVEQTYKNLEIILVDDGSPDNCPAMCDEWARKDSRIAVIHKENGGVSSARNAGLAACTGDYVGFVDSDDWIEPDMYEYLLDISMKSNADVSRCAFVIELENPEVDIDLQNDSKLRVLHGDELIIELVNGEYNEGIMCNKLYKSECIKDLRLNENIKIAEDCLLNYHIYSRGITLVSSDSVKYHYLGRNDSATNSVFSEKSFDILKVHNEITNSEINNPATYPYCLKTYIRYNIIYLRTCIAYERKFYRDDMRNEVKKYSSAILHSPICDKKLKFRVFLITYMFPLYKLMVNVKCHGRDIIRKMDCGVLMIV